MGFVEGLRGWQGEPGQEESIRGIRGLHDALQDIVEFVGVGFGVFDCLEESDLGTQRLEEFVLAADQVGLGEFLKLLQSGRLLDPALSVSHVSGEGSVICEVCAQAGL